MPKLQYTQIKYENDGVNNEDDYRGHARQQHTHHTATTTTKTLAKHLTIIKTCTVIYYDDDRTHIYTFAIHTHTQNTLWTIKITTTTIIISNDDDDYDDENKKNKPAK